MNSGDSKDVPMDIEKAEVILAALRQQYLTIGQFLRIVLDPCNEDKLKSSSHSALSAFLQGRTITGTRPIDTVKLMFHHCLSQDGLRVGLTYHRLPIYARPPTIPSLHPQSHFSSLDAMLDGMDPPGLDTQSVQDGLRACRSLKQYFLHEVLEEVNNKVRTLVEDGSLHAEGPAVLSWTKMLEFSFMQTQELILKKAPALWSVLTMAAIGNGNASCLLAVPKEAQEGMRGCGKNNMRDPWLVSKARNLDPVC